jgi:hypothetical protein
MTYWLDYQLWPDSPVMMHFHSLTWFGLLVFLAACLYRRVLAATWMAGLAAFFFAVDDAHGVPVGWLANRNSLIACVFGVLCLIAHDRWRREGWRSGVIVGPVCLSLALVSKEEAIAVGGYLLTYTLFLERGSLQKRIVPLMPYVLIFLLWSLAYMILGFGAQGFRFYIDPLNDPITYLTAFFYHAPVYLLGQWVLPLFLYNIWPSAMHMAGLIFVVLLALIIIPLLRQDRIARFWTAGMFLSLLPICATVPMDRNLLFTGLGAMGLLAQWVHWVDQTPSNAQLTMRRFANRILLALFILMHGVLAPISLPISTRAFGQISNQVVRANASLPSGIAYQEKKFILVNTPIHGFFVRDLAGHRLLQEQFNLLRALTSGNHSLTLAYKDFNTIEIRSQTGSLTDLDAYFLAKKNISMCQGQKIELDDMIIEVLQVEDGLPSAASFTFLVPLEDSNLLWFQWADGKYVPFTLPAVGETITVEGARFTMG